MKQRIKWKCIEIKEQYNDGKNGEEIWGKEIEIEARKSSNLSNNGVKCKWRRR